MIENNRHIAGDEEAEIPSEQDVIARQDELKELLRKVEIVKREQHKIMDSVGDMIILTDDEGKIKRVNKAVQTFSSKPYKEILGMDWEELIFENDLEAVTLYVESTELFQRTTNKWFTLTAYPFEDSELNYSGTVITLHETTELKIVSEELENTNKNINLNREKLQAALKQISILMQNVTTQKETSIRLTNDHLVKCYELKKCEKPDCICYGKDAMRCWQVAGTYCGGELQGSFAQKYGNCAECDVFEHATSDPIYQMGEQFNNMMNVMDTKNRELQEALGNLKSSQSTVLHQEKMASIGQLAAGVAHEINNPTGFITSNLGTLNKYVSKLSSYISTLSAIVESGESPETVEEVKKEKKKLKIDYILNDLTDLISESLDGANRIKVIVQNLKSFSRVDEADCKHSDINECMESTLNIVWNELKYKAAVTKEYGDLPQVKCFPQQINQVFMNILVNASHAIEDQGEIKIKTWNGDGWIHISISDTGSGIPEEKVTKIFEPFFTTKDVGKGTGLGLSITYEIIQKHHGEILVDSEVGKGTTFTIKLPVNGPDLKSA